MMELYNEIFYLKNKVMMDTAYKNTYHMHSHPDPDDYLYAIQIFVI